VIEEGPKKKVYRFARDKRVSIKLFRQREGSRSSRKSGTLQERCQDFCQDFSKNRILFCNSQNI
jgi:hypothetical protein